MTAPVHTQVDRARLALDIRAWAAELGFQQAGIAQVQLAEDEAWLLRWLQLGRHGEMAYMAHHGSKRSRPDELVPGTLSVVSLRMDYLHAEAHPILELVEAPERAAISRYALGRDYHKLMRKRLQRLASRIKAAVGDFGYRVFVDSAPVLERALARNAGLGWIGKHTNLIHPRAGSWFFLGEIYTDLPLAADGETIDDHCGTCTRCLEACPTGAIVAPYEVDARLCISYLTIELRGSIPEALRPLIGNRIFGCDDCQAVCPWNRFAQPSREADFSPRDGLDGPPLVDLFAWSEEEWSRRTEGSPLRRAGYAGWLRNIAVALGNGPPSAQAVAALRSRAEHPSALVREHVEWALRRLAG
ncbi:MAG TPA: tRNA epoxyqueuosine(34) reductase QueG [Xanthomonadaceae bacterium]|nr:tRNA epoxyqueuosine(34) reductase QueG [Xanthomonadaceae bacterium]